MKLIWYPFHVADYARDTAHLSMLEHGAYRLLLDHYYMTGAPLPASAEQLHRICRAVADAEQRALQYVVDQFFTLTDLGYVHARVEEELAKSRDLSEKRRQAAAASHSGRFGKLESGEANAGASAEQVHEQLHTQSQSQLQVSTTHVVEKAKKPARKATQLPADFYPDETGVSYADSRRVNLANELESFRNWHTAKGSTMKDWQAAWRTWCDKAVEFGRSSKPINGRQPTLQEQRAANIAELTGRTKQNEPIDITPSARLLG